jgi:hypothetical protein
VSELDDRRRRRDDVLVELYNRAVAGRGSLEFVEEPDIAKALGVEESEVETAGRYLVDEGLATYPVFGSVLSITSGGTRRAEEIIEEREREAAALGGLFLTPGEVQDVEAAIGPLRAALDDGEIPLAGDDLAEFDADVRAIETQIVSPRPKRGIVGTALHSIAEFLARPDLVVGIAASGTVQVIFELAKRIH